MDILYPRCAGLDVHKDSVVAWFEIGHFWVTRATESRRLLRPDFGCEVGWLGGGQPPQIKRVAAERVRGPTGSANAHGLDRSSIPAGFCRCARQPGCG